MLLFKSFTILIIGFVLLIKGADFFVEGSSVSGERKIKKRTPKSNLSGEPEGVKGAIGKPPCRARRREIPAPSCQNQATLL